MGSHSIIFLIKNPALPIKFVEFLCTLMQKK